MSEFVTVCMAEDVPEGGGRSFRLGELVVGVFRVHGEFYAIDDRCPHAGASLALGSLDDGRPVVRCRIHHWGFCLKSGRYVDQESPHFDARAYITRVVGGEVQIQVGQTR